MMQFADIVIMPYAYLLDSKIREDTFKQDTVMGLENKIIIFDEAHNIEKIAEEGASLNFSVNGLVAAKKELDSLDEVISKVLEKDRVMKRENILWIIEGVKSVIELLKEMH
jgi:Rad3-related DNA helicase